MSNTINSTNPIAQNALYRLQTRNSLKGIIATPGSEQGKPSEALKNAGLNALSTRNMQPIGYAAYSGRFDNVDFSKAVGTGNLNGGAVLQQEYTIANYNGRDFYLYDSENEKYFNDPNVRVSETGYLLRHTSGFNTLGGSIQLLGKAVDAPDYVPPKHTADFFDASSDFIQKAALELAKNGTEETLNKPQYSSDQFVSSVLDFFSKGDFTQKEMEITKASIESIIKELSEMIRNGEEADLNKVNGKVDILGEQVSITHLLEMQEYGKELSNQLTGAKYERVGLGSDNVSEFARKGLIKSMGMSHGDQIGGAIGEMFKSAWGAEVDRHSEVSKNLGDYAIQGEAQAWHSDALKNGASYIYDVFSKIDTSSKENALKSFNDLSGEIDAAIQKFLDQYTDAPGPEKMRAEVNSYFNELMGFKSVDVKA